jgi:hypothetical protein
MIHGLKNSSLVLRIDDVESTQRPRENLEGYEDFSKYIASDADLSIYRRFGALGARNILYLQGELQALEAQLQKLDDEDREEIDKLSDNRRRDVVWAAKSWESFYRQAGNEGRQAEKMKLVIRLREVMKEYGELKHYSKRWILITIRRSVAPKESGTFIRIAPQWYLGSIWELVPRKETFPGTQLEPP